MGETLDLGQRVELVPMDPHCHDITLALYRQVDGHGPRYRVHSYSKHPDTAQRLAFVAKTMVVLGGMERVPDSPNEVRFPCGAEHLLACRRVFLEACKLAPEQPLATRPLHIHDKKSDRTISVIDRGGGHYGLSADGDEEGKAERNQAVANGLAKLGEMQIKAPDVAFACGRAHDALVGLLLVRALNVRAVLREAELTAARGVLAAPSAQR